MDFDVILLVLAVIGFVLLPFIYVRKNDTPNIYLGIRITLCWLVVFIPTVFMSWATLWRLSI